MANEIKVGVLPWGQYTDWPPLLEVGRRADELGYDSLWTWDHLYPIQGDWRGPIFEGYLILAGWTGRHVPRDARPDGRGKHVPQPRPRDEDGDHARSHERRSSDPRDWRRVVRARARGLRDRLRVGLRGAPGLARRGRRPDARRCSTRKRPPPGARTTTRSAFETTRGPLQAHLPILIGGSGEKKTLHTVAKYADAWNAGGEVE